MIRITTLLWIALLVVAGGTVMYVSYQVARVERHLAELARDARQEQDAIRILGAEWDSLNDPSRIDSLSKRYLSLESTPVRRVVMLENIPLKPSPEQIEKLDAAAAKGTKTQPARKPIMDAKTPPQVIMTAGNKAAAPAPSAPPAPLMNSADGVGLILARAERRE
jgi:hypothetical protein